MIQETQKENQTVEDHELIRSDANIDTVENLILSQESDPSTHLILREIEMETGIPRASVDRIANLT